MIVIVLLTVKLSNAIVALEVIVTNKKLLKGLEKLTEVHHTGEFGSYHSVITKYAPERKHFSYNGMVARTQLAILDHNAKVGRKHAEIKNVSSHGRETVLAWLWQEEKELGSQEN